MKKFFTLLITTCLTAFSANTQTSNFTVTLDEAQANMGNGTGSSAMGTGTATYDHSTMNLTVNFSYEESQLNNGTGSVTAAHVHEAVAGQNGSVIMNLGTANPNMSSKVFDNSGGSTPEQKENSLLNNGMYINVHTTSVGGGEIRGQLILQSPLPVEFTTFTLRNLNGSSVALNWTTNSEIDNSYFSIERSVDEKIFSSIGKVYSSDAISYPQSYTFVDKETNIGQNLYYRLKQVDFDGAYEYSPIRSIKLDSKKLEVLNVYPNPVKADRTVLLEWNSTKNSSNGSIRLINSAGEIVFQYESLFQEGYNQQELQLTDLPSGIYWLNIENQPEQSGKLIIVQ